MTSPLRSALIGSPVLSTSCLFFNRCSTERTRICLRAAAGASAVCLSYGGGGERGYGHA